MQKVITQLITERFNKLKHKLPMQNGVIDFVIIKNEPFVIELNPFNDY